MGLILPGAPQFSRYESNIAATPATSLGAAVSHYVTTAHTKNPTCTELIASSAFDASLVVVTLGNNSGANTNTSTLLDILIGAASAETVIIPDLMAGWASITSSGATRYYVFPLYIPAGSRISARTQSVRTSGSVYCLVQLYGGPKDPDRWWCGQQVTCYGANAANSAGTKFTPGNSGAEGTPVSLGTTTAHHDCLVLGVQGHPDDASWGTSGYHFDVGIDSSSTEWLLTDGYYALGTSNETIGNVIPWWPIFRPIPSGTEIMVMGESGGTADALSAAIYGVS